MLGLRIFVISTLTLTGHAQINPLTFLGNLMLNPGGVHAPLPEEFLLTKELIDRVGFEHERYEVITEDGYILALHRIVNSSRRKRTLKIPVLVMHGFVATSDYLVIRDRENALPFVLTDEGYDVWLCDFRGNFFSRSHVFLSPDGPMFWNFTFHEHGLYDLPAFIDRILEVSEQPKLLLIGYSLSCSSILVMNSLRPEYNDKIYLSVHLGPAPLKVSANKMKNPFMKFLMKNPVLIKIHSQTMNDLNIFELIPRTAKSIEAVEKTCGANGTSPKVCVTAIRDFYGNNIQNLDKEILVEITKRCPAGTSMRMLSHVFQILTRGWKQYDWGEEENIKIYGTAQPPEYPLERVTSQNLIIYGANDYYSTLEGNAHLASLLRPNLTRIVKVDDPKFSHFDYVFGRNAKQKVVKTIIDEFELFSNKKRDTHETTR